MNRKHYQESLADAVIPEAIDLAREMRRHRVEQGMDAEYFRKARPALAFIGAGARILATIENGLSNDMIERRLAALEGKDGAALPPGEE